MDTNLYRNEQIEQEMLRKIDISAANRYGEDIPADVQDRIETEKQHIIDSGHGTILAVAAKLVEFSANRGYPVGIRGLVGNLYLAHLLGISVNDPLVLGLHWRGFLGLDGTRMQPITLNVAPALLDDMTAYLADLLPGYAPDDYPTVKLCPHELMGLVGQARQQSGVVPRTDDIFSPASIATAYHADVSSIPVLSDLTGLAAFTRTLEPRNFLDLVKLMGLCLSDGIWFQLDYLVNDGADPFADLIGTREDVYDILVRYGIGEDDAFRVMQQVRGGYGKLTEKYKNMLESNKKLPGVFMEVLKSVDYLYPRGQCADYIYWVLSLLWYREHAQN